MVRGKKTYSGSQKSKFNGNEKILRKVFVEVKTGKRQALPPRVLTGIIEQPFIAI